MVKKKRKIGGRVRRLIRDWKAGRIVTVHGVKLDVSARNVGPEIRAGVLSGVYEEPERELLNEALESNDRVLEFGGCIGYLSLLCAHVVGAENVLCYEPIPRAARALMTNFELNGCHPHFRQRAITVDGGDVKLFAASNLMSSSLFRRAEGEFITVASDRFDGVIGAWKPTILVVDVEGAECDLLPSSEMQGVSKIVLETHAKVVGQEPTETLINHLLGIGFSIRSSRHNRLFLVR